MSLKVKKIKVFTVTISVPSVKAKKEVHNDMSNHVFLFCYKYKCNLYSMQNSIKVIHVTNRVASNQGVSISFIYPFTKQT